jgi:glycosyltransferase involved in cell wall biosynthesis
MLGYLAMKILQLLSNPNIGGTETFVVGISKEFLRLGCEISICNLRDNVELKTFAEKQGLEYHDLARVGHFGLMNGLENLRALIVTHGFDVICTYGIRASMILRFIAHTINPRPRIMVGLRSVDNWRCWWHVWPDRSTQKLVDMFVGNSEEVCTIRRKRERTPQKQLCCIPNGIDISHFSPKAECWPNRNTLGLPEGVLCITVANLRRAKGHEFLLKTIASLGDLPQKVSFAFVGGGTDKTLFENMAKEMGLSGRVIFCGQQNDVRPFLFNSDLFVLPSEYEGMPRALMEAMAMGIPTIATDVGGTGEVLRDGKDGFLVPYGNVDEAVFKLRTLIDDRNLRQRFGQNARDRICRSFNFTDIARCYTDLFITMLQAK